MEKVCRIFRECFVHGLALILYLGIILIYSIINRSNLDAINITTSLDNITPFIRIFIIPYYCWYVFMFFSLFYFLVKNKISYYKMLIGLSLGILIAYIIFISYQTTVSRPLVVGDDALSRLVRFTYERDNPVNCFPSIHVFTSCMIMKISRYNENTDKVYKCIAHTLGILIIFSTVFVKQHVWVDVVGGIVLSNLCFNIVSLINNDIIGEFVYKVDTFAINKIRTIFYKENHTDTM